MGFKFKSFIGICIIWYVWYILFLTGNTADWPTCLLIGLILTPLIILAMIGLGAMEGATWDFKDRLAQDPSKKQIQNNFNYLGGLIILWSMFFLPVLGYISIDNIQYSYWLLGIFRYNDPKLLFPPPGFMSIPFITISGTFSFFALLLIYIAINYYSHEDKPIIILLLGIISMAILIGFYFWQLYELTPMLRELNFPRNRTLLPAIGFYSIMIGGVITIVGGIKSIFFPSKITPTELLKETSELPT